MIPTRSLKSERKLANGKPLIKLGNMAKLKKSAVFTETIKLSGRQKNLSMIFISASGLAKNLFLFIILNKILSLGTFVIRKSLNVFLFDFYARTDCLRESILRLPWILLVIEYKPAFSLYFSERNLPSMKF